MAPSAPANGFWTKLFASIAGALIVSFFGWLGLSVVQIKNQLAGMDVKVDGLIETRRDQAIEQRQNINQRLGHVENLGETQP